MGSWLCQPQSSATSGLVNNETSMLCVLMDIVLPPLLLGIIWTLRCHKMLFKGLFSLCSLAVISVQWYVLPISQLV